MNHYLFYFIRYQLVKYNQFGQKYFDAEIQIRLSAIEKVQNWQNLDCLAREFLIFKVRVQKLARIFVNQVRERRSIEGFKDAQEAKEE